MREERVRVRKRERERDLGKTVLEKYLWMGSGSVSSTHEEGCPGSEFDHLSVSGLPVGLREGEGGREREKVRV